MAQDCGAMGGLGGPLTPLPLPSAAGVGATCAGASHFASGTSPQGGTWRLPRTRAWWWLMPARPTPRPPPSASASPRSVGSGCPPLPGAPSPASGPTLQSVSGVPSLTAQVLRLTFAPCPSLQEKLDVAPKRDVEGMGPPEIKYGESLCFVQHVTSGLWLTYAAPDPKALRLGVLKKKVGTQQGKGWTEARRD